METIKAPFTPEQVKNLKEWQEGPSHEFTCGGLNHPEGKNNVLIPTEEGWKCPSCDYTQDWAYLNMADGSFMNNFYNSEFGKLYLKHKSEENG